MSKPKPTDKPGPSAKVQSVEQQNDIYRKLFAQAGMQLPDVKQLGNFKIPKLKCPEKIRTSNEKYEWARNVVDYGREPEPKLSYGRPPGWKPPQQQHHQFPPPFQNVPRMSSPQASHFGSMVGNSGSMAGTSGSMAGASGSMAGASGSMAGTSRSMAGTSGSVSGTRANTEFSRAKKFAKKATPVPAQNHRWTRSATQRFKDFSSDSEFSSGSSEASGRASMSSVSSTGAVGSPKSSVSGRTVYVNPKFLAGQLAEQAEQKGKKKTSSPETSSTSCSSWESNDSVFSWDVKFSPLGDEFFVEGDLAMKQEPGAGQLMETGIPEPDRPSASSGYSSSGNGNTGRRRGSLLVVKKEPGVIPNDVKSEDINDDEGDDLDVLVIGLSKEERLEVDSWDTILKNRRED